MALTIRSAQTIGNGVRLVGNTATITTPNIYLPSTLFELDASTYAGSGDWVDSTGNGRNGILYSNPNWSSEVGGCFSFTAGLSQYIEVLGSEYGWGLANSPAQATFSVWANIPSVAGYQHIAGWRGGFQFWFLILTGSSITEARFDNGVARDINIDYGAFMGTWAYTTFVVDAAAGESRLYINGSMVGSASSISGNFSGGGGTFTLGSDQGLGFPSTSKIGGATAYSKALDVNEINTEFNRTRTRYGL